MTIDKKIHDLVVRFNQCGFKTYAAGQGLGLRPDVTRPYIAFRCEVGEAGEPARLLKKLQDYQVQHIPLIPDEPQNKFNGSYA